MAIDFEELASKGMSADQLANVFLREYYNGAKISYPINPFQILKDLRIAFVLRPFNKRSLTAESGSILWRMTLTSRRLWNIQEKSTEGPSGSSGLYILRRVEG